MELLNFDTLIFSYLKQIDRNEVPVQDIIEYFKEVKERLEKTNYIVDKCDTNKVLKFTHFYSTIVKFENGNLIIKDLGKLHHLIEKFHLDGTNEEIKKYLLINERYILPFIYDDKFIIYQFSSSDKKLDSIKSNFYYDKHNNNGYLIDLNVLKEDFICDVISKGHCIKLQEFSNKRMGDYIIFVEEILNSKKINNYFGIDNFKNDLLDKYDSILKYYEIGNNNTNISFDTIKALEKHKNLH